MNWDTELNVAEGKVNLKELVSALCDLVWTWQGGDISNAMDGDEVEEVVRLFRKNLNRMQGNI